MGMHRCCAMCLKRRVLVSCCRRIFHISALGGLSMVCAIRSLSWAVPKLFQTVLFCWPLILCFCIFRTPRLVKVRPTRGLGTHTMVCFLSKKRGNGFSVLRRNTPLFRRLQPLCRLLCRSRDNILAWPTKPVYDVISSKWDTRASPFSRTPADFSCEVCQLPWNRRLWRTRLRIRLPQL